MVKSKYCSLLNCLSSGFHLLLETSLANDAVNHSLSEVGAIMDNIVSVGGLETVNYCTGTIRVTAEVLCVQDCLRRYVCTKCEMF